MRLGARVALAVAATALAGCSAAAAPSSPTTTTAGSPSVPGSGVGRTGTKPTTSLNTTTTTTLERPSVFGVGIRDVTVVDHSRPTIDYETGRVLHDDRVIETQIRYPIVSLDPGAPPAPGATPATAFGPFPVVVFAHGYAVTPHTYEPLLDSWVRAGFVVVAPVFPVDNYYGWEAEGGGHAPEADISNEPEDVVVATRAVAQLAAEPRSWLQGVANFGRLALAGQSDGASVVAALEFGASNGLPADRERLPSAPRAVAVLSGQELGGGVTYATARPAPGLLSVESDSDGCNPTGAAAALYDAVARGTTERWFVRLEGADHLGPYDGQDPWFASVSSVTTAFFDLTLQTPPARGRAGPSSVVTAGTRDGVSSVSAAASVLLPPTSDRGACGVPSPNP